jgi:hypothetical protein
MGHAIPDLLFGPRPEEKLVLLEIGVPLLGRHLKPIGMQPTSQIAIRRFRQIDQKRPQIGFLLE